MAALEVVLTTAIAIPSLIFLTYLGLRACRVLYSVVGSMIGSPLM